MTKLNIGIYSKFGQHYRYDITMYDFFHIIQFLIPIWSWISKMMLENETFFHFSFEIGFLFSWHLKLIDFVLGSLVEVCELSYKYLVCSFSEFVDCSNRLTKNLSDSLTVSPADIIFLNCEEFSTALSSTNRLELSWKCFDIPSPLIKLLQIFTGHLKGLIILPTAGGGLGRFLGSQWDLKFSAYASFLISWSLSKFELI